MKNLLSIRSYNTKPVSHSHAYNQLVLPLRGVINISVEAFSGKVGPRECVIVRAQQQHLFRAEPEARFVVADMNKLPQNLADSSSLVFEISKPLLSFLLFVESQLENQVNPVLEEAMFDTFVLLLKEQPLTPKLDPRINQVLQFIDEHIDEALSIDGLSKVAYLSPTQLKKTFKKQMGGTVLEYITRVRMEKAQALLIHTDYPLQMIGEKVGYRDLSAFSRRFKQHFGLSPLKFKNS